MSSRSPALYYLNEISSRNHIASQLNTERIIIDTKSDEAMILAGLPPPERLKKKKRDHPYNQAAPAIDWSHSRNNHASELLSHQIPSSFDTPNKRQRSGEKSRILSSKDIYRRVSMPPETNAAVAASVAEQPHYKCSQKLSTVEIR